MYRIKKYTFDAAKKINVIVKPSKTKGKKIDVFKNGKKIYSIGAIGYNDYPTWLIKKGKNYADKRKSLYKIRHAKNIKIKYSRGWYASKLLW